MIHDLLLPDPVRKATSSRSSLRYIASPPPFISFIWSPDLKSKYFFQLFSWLSDWLEKLKTILIEVHFCRPLHLLRVVTSTVQWGTTSRFLSHWLLAAIKVICILCSHWKDTGHWAAQIIFDIFASQWESHLLGEQHFVIFEKIVSAHKIHLWFKVNC